MPTLHADVVKFFNGKLPGSPFGPKTSEWAFGDWLAGVDNESPPDGGITVDTISELTAAAGVTIDGVLLKDSAVTTDTLIEKTAAAGVTIDGALVKDGSFRLGTITDPGNAGAIPVTKSGICAITTAGAETRTLAIPSFFGQEIILAIDTDGGTCVITSAQTLNATGNNTITMADVRDMIRLVGITVGGALRWSVAGNDGSVLSTV